DQVLARAERLALAPGAFVARGAPRVLTSSTGMLTRDGKCASFSPLNPTARISVEVPPGGLGLVATAPSSTTVNVRRFAAAATAPIGTVADTPATLRVPSDAVNRPW